MSDQWETFCDVGYYHMWRLRRVTERGWNDGFHINTRDEAKALCGLLNKLEREVAETKEQCSNLDDQVSSAMMVIRGLERERDEARGCAEVLHCQLQVVGEMYVGGQVPPLPILPWFESGLDLSREALIAAVKGGSDE